MLACFLFTIGLQAAVVVPPTATEPMAPPATEETIREAALEYRASLKEMSAGERRELKREQRRALKDALKNHRQGSDDMLLLVIIAIFIPPLAMYLHQGEINGKFWISLLLTLLFYIPGLVYTLITILGS